MESTGKIWTRNQISVVAKECETLLEVAVKFPILFIQSTNTAIATS
jgi:hypothetical protein